MDEDEDDPVVQALMRAFDEADATITGTIRATLEDGTNHGVAVAWIGWQWIGWAWTVMSPTYMAIGMGFGTTAEGARRCALWSQYDDAWQGVAEGKISREDVEARIVWDQDERHAEDHE